MRAALLVPVLSMVCYGQSLEDTKAYILRELPQAQSDLSRTVFDGFTTMEGGRLLLQMHTFDPVDNITRHHLIPIDSVDMTVSEGRFGTSLIAKPRRGGLPLRVYVKGREPLDIPMVVVVGNSPTPEKVQKLHRAFTHLIELVSGRKELF